MRPERPSDRDALAGALGVHPLTAQCLLNRGIEDSAAAREFLRAGLSTLLRPEGLPDAKEAIARIRRALRDGERICVWGDYDVDGISGAALLVRFLRMLGARVTAYIPERTGSGYGFHWPTMERFIGQGVTLFVSVDHGSTAVEQIRNANERGVDTIVVDHHEMAPTLPEAVAVINPKRPDSEYAFQGLCGAGVAMKLAWAVAQDLSPGARVSEEMRAFLVEALGMAVLGTVADVVPLRGENRVIVRHGLAVLERQPRPGLAALLDVSRAAKPLRASDIGFKLGPRLNAAGRMGSASLALELLLTDDPSRAREIAERLDAENNRRRAVEKEVAADARERVLAELGPNPSGIALLGDGWHQGVIGIVAARLVDEFHAPTVLVGVNEGVGRGSARSVDGFELHTALAACGKHLEAHGGHAAAAGLTVVPKRFAGFQKAFHSYVEEHLPAEARVPTLHIDAVARPEDLTPAVAASLERLEPFGRANPEPVLALERVSLAGKPRRMGQSEDHLAFHLGRGGTAIRCVAFRKADAYEPLLREGGLFDVAFTPQRNTFRGRTDIEAHVVDLRPSVED